MHESGNSLTQRFAASFFTEDVKSFKKKSLAWAQKFSVVCALDNNEYWNHKHQREEFLLGAGAETEITTDINCFQSLQNFISENQYHKFGFICYDAKNEIEKLHSKNPDELNFPLLHFFSPEVFIRLKGNELVIESAKNNCAEIFQAIDSSALSPIHESKSPVVYQRMSKDEYLQKVKAVQEHIRQGDVYELNLCLEFHCENYSAEPLQLFFQLNEISPAPFSSFYKLKNKFLICSSPERFLGKQGDKIFSHPMKGTMPRGKNDADDLQLKHELRQSEKERAENVMIVDLVRNDLSRSCMAGSVKVEELFGIYSYPRVHQMVSTVSGTLREEIKITDAIKNAFPMGSMTGAPKIRAMQLIDELENSRRGLFSGCVGYFNSENDFDFNVVIRSILYDTEKNYLSFSAGSAITIDSIAETEWEECLLKAENIRRIL